MNLYKEFMISVLGTYYVVVGKGGPSLSHQKILSHHSL